MVWKTTQSAFYRAVDSFNNGENICDERDVPRKEIRDEKTASRSPEKHPENGRGNRRSGDETRRTNDRAARGCPRRVRQRQPEPLAKIFSDNDMLLIAGLILILSRQNTDQKLILALAFVLLT